MKFLAIKGYWKHQHYHQRGAPWIKVYAALLDDDAFMQLPENAQAQLMKLWILASSFGHPLPNNPKLLAGKIGATKRFHLDALIASGFLILCEDEAQVFLASGKQNASKTLDALRGEERGERTEHPAPASARDAELEAGLATMLETDADRNALTVVVARATSRGACLTALTSMLTGNDPATPQPSPALFGQALRDMAMNGAPPTARKIRNYLADAKRSQEEPGRPPTNGAGARPSIGARAFVTTLDAIKDL